MNKAFNLLVCVTDQISCKRLIRKGVGIRGSNEGELHVLHVARTGLNFLDSDKQGEALEYLYNEAKSVGANLSVVKSDNIIETIAAYAVENEITDVVVGASGSHGEITHTDEMFDEKLKKKLKHIRIHVVA